MSLLGKVNIRDTVRFTENDAIPIYRQIAESLRQSILSGEFKEGCKLPSESEFAKELHSEMEKVVLMDELPDNWTYQLIQSKLIL